MTFVRRVRPRRLFLAAILLAILAFPATPAAAEPATQPPASYIVVDAGTGQVVAAKGEHDPHFTASTIKVFTALIALEHLPVSAPVPVSNLAARQPASKIDMKEGSTWTLDQALHSLLIISANDAAYAIAESAGGDLAGFERMANATGKRLGLRDTTFHDPAGLDGAEGFEGGTQSSAYDLAIVARNALTVPAIADTAVLKTYEFTDPTGAGRRLVNHNRGFLTSYPGAIGLKTGFTKQAGRTLITAARRDGRTLIAVVMNTWDDTGWSGFLLDQAFAGTSPPATASPAQLPPVRTVPYDARTAQFAAIPAAFDASLSATMGGEAPPTASATAAAPTTDSTVATTATTAVPKAEPAVAPAAVGAAAAPTTTSDTGSSAFGTIARVVGITLFALLVVGFVLRRRAVKRQRARRIERLRAHREARRRGMIDYVEPDDADVRVVPAGTGHHVSASRRHPNERRVQRGTRPRRDLDTTQDRRH